MDEVSKKEIIQLMAFCALCERVPDVVIHLINHAKLGQSTSSWLDIQEPDLDQEDFITLIHACSWIDQHFLKAAYHC